MRMRVLRDVIATPTDQTTQFYPAGWTGTAPRGVIAQLVAAGAAERLEPDPEPEPAGDQTTAEPAPTTGAPPSDEAGAGAEPEGQAPESDAAAEPLPRRTRRA